MILYLLGLNFQQTVIWLCINDQFRLTCDAEEAGTWIFTFWEINAISNHSIFETIHVIHHFTSGCFQGSSQHFFSLYYYIYSFILIELFSTLFLKGWT